MQKLDRSKFLFLYEQQQFGTMPDKAQAALLALLDFLEADEKITDLRHGAYLLATTLHETAGTYRPIHEYGKREYFIKRYGSQTRVGKELGNDTPEEGASYAGRGFPQTTGEGNYEMAEAALRKEYPAVVARFEARTGKKFDLTVGDQPNDGADPDNMLDPEIAYCTMSYAMRKGAFTGVGLSRYINGEKCDFLHARKIINGMDCAERIAGYATKILACLEGAAIQEAADAGATA